MCCSWFFETFQQSTKLRKCNKNLKNCFCSQLDVSRAAICVKLLSWSFCQDPVDMTQSVLWMTRNRHKPQLALSSNACVFWTPRLSPLLEEQSWLHHDSGNFLHAFPKLSRLENEWDISDKSQSLHDVFKTFQQSTKLRKCNKNLKNCFCSQLDVSRAANRLPRKQTADEIYKNVSSFPHHQNPHLLLESMAAEWHCSRFQSAVGFYIRLKLFPFRMNKT